MRHHEATQVHLHAVAQRREGTFELAELLKAFCGGVFWLSSEALEDKGGRGCRSSAVGLLQHRCGIDQLFVAHVVAPHVEDLALGKPDGATRLRRAAVAAVGVQRGKALAYLLALGHVLPAVERHKA
jgi:hypothetical protein